MLAIGSVRHARWPYQAGLNLRFLGLKLDERDRAGGAGGTAQTDRAKHDPNERRSAASADHQMIRPRGHRDQRLRRVA
jgi:hypothetical protein